MSYRHGMWNNWNILDNCFQMSHLLQLVIELVLINFFLGYRDGANNSFNDWFLLNTDVIQSCGKIVFKLGSMYSKDKCFLNKLLRSRSLGLYFIMSLTFLLAWLFWLVDFCLACCLDKVETCANCLWIIDDL